MIYIPTQTLHQVVNMNKKYRLTPRDSESAFWHIMQRFGAVKAISKDVVLPQRECNVKMTGMFIAQG